MDLILDANVLIDYLDADRFVLPLLREALGTIHVPTLVLDEVKGLGEEEAVSLGLRVCEEPLELIGRASEPSGRLSPADTVCCLLARDNGWTCVTNDRLLRERCSTEGVRVLWGLELLFPPLQRGMLPLDRAIEIARSIGRGNPQYITPAILERFESRAIGIARDRDGTVQEAGPTQGG